MYFWCVPNCSVQFSVDTKLSIFLSTCRIVCLASYVANCSVLISGCKIVLLSQCLAQNSPGAKLFGCQMVSAPNIFLRYIFFSHFIFPVRANGLYTHRHNIVFAFLLFFFSLFWLFINILLLLPVRANGLVDTVSARKFLEAADKTGDKRVFFTVFRFLFTFELLWR